MKTSDLETCFSCGYSIGDTCRCITPIPTGIIPTFEKYSRELSRVLLDIDDDPIELLINTLTTAGTNGRTIFVMGNGGSAATASHFSCDLAKNTKQTACKCGHSRDNHKFYYPEAIRFFACDVCDCGTYETAGKRPFRVICLNDNAPSITAYSNDIAYHSVFVEQLENLMQSDDVVIGISGSGKSANVLRAIEWANEGGAITAGLTGFNGGHLFDMAQIKIHVPCDVYEIIEDVHMMILHSVVKGFKDE